MYTGDRTTDDAGLIGVACGDTGGSVVSGTSILLEETQTAVSWSVASSSSSDEGSSRSEQGAAGSKPPRRPASCSGSSSTAKSPARLGDTETEFSERLGDLDCAEGSVDAAKAKLSAAARRRLIAHVAGSHVE